MSAKDVALEDIQADILMFTSFYSKYNVSRAISSTKRKGGGGSLAGVKLLQFLQFFL